MANVTWHQKVVGYLAYLLSIFILLLILVWMGRFRGGFAWSSNVSVGDPYLVFNLHPVMMTLGFLVFPVQAMFVYRLLPMEHFKAKVYHFVCHVFSMICIAIGISAAIVYHYRKKDQHMITLHSWFGIGTMGLFGFQFLTGFLGYCWPKLSFEARKSSLPLHQFIGVLTFIMACATSSLGIMQKIIDVRAQDSTVAAIGSEVQLANWTGLAIALLMAFVLYVIMAGVGKKVKERASFEEVESLRQKSSYDHDY